MASAVAMTLAWPPVMVAVAAERLAEAPSVAGLTAKAMTPPSTGSRTGRCCWP